MRRIIWEEKNHRHTDQSLIMNTQPVTLPPRPMVALKSKTNKPCLHTLRSNEKAVSSNTTRLQHNFLTYPCLSWRHIWIQTQASCLLPRRKSFSVARMSLARILLWHRKNLLLLMSGKGRQGPLMPTSVLYPISHNQPQHQNKFR